MRHHRSLDGIAATVIATGIVLLSPHAVAAADVGIEPSLHIGEHTAPPGDDGRYTVLVRFGQPSLAAWHAASVAGSAQTRHRLDPQRADARARLADIDRDQQQHLARISQLLGRDVQPLQRYRHVVNGVSLRLTLDEALRLQRSGLVRAVELDAEAEPLGDVGPDVIGAPFVWLGGGNNGLSNRGEGVVIGIVDSGVRHAHPSFAAVAPGDGYTHVNPRGAGNVLGLCVTTPALCNHKLIGSYEFTGSLSAEDGDGHGTSSTSIAAGNPVVASEAGLSIPISGVAPRANIINYRACVFSCLHSWVVAAIEQAVVDSVDVLSLTISGPDDPWNNSIDLALLDAVAAGVFVVNAAGNTGPSAGSVTRTAPWAATVATTTHSRLIAHDIDAAGLNTRGVPSAGPPLAATLTTALIDAPTFAPGNGFGCSPYPEDSLTAAVVLVERGNCTFATKIDLAAAAGAAAVLVFNNVAGPPVPMGGTGGTPIPALMINRQSGLALRALIDGASMTTLHPVASISHHPTSANIVHAIGGRGPSRFDVVKPDFAAPGVNTLAADLAAEGDYSQRFGTSFAGAHVTGAAALLAGEKPTWSPSALRSALALTARSNGLRGVDGVTPATPFDSGSGLIDVGAASRVPLVLEESAANFAAADPASGGDPRTLNLPGLVDRACFGGCSFTRTVTSVIGQSQDYVVSTHAAPGFTVTVTPDSFTLAAGASQALQIDVDVDPATAALAEWQFGQIAIEPTGAARARLLDEGFDDAVFPPPGWSTYRLEGTGPQQWARDTIAAFSAPASARYRWSFSGDGRQDGWLVTPRLHLPADAVLQFRDRAEYMDFYDYSGVMVSTGSCDPAHGAFTQLREIADTPSAQWRVTPVEIDLSAHAGHPVCLAFRYRGDYAHTWQIDDVRLEAPHPTLRMPLAVLAEAPTVTISPSSLPPAQRNTAWTQTLAAAGAGTAAPYTFSLAAGALPPGLSLSAGGVLSGTPSTVGSFSFTVAVADSTAAGAGGPFIGSREYTLDVLDARIFRDGFEAP